MEKEQLRQERAKLSELKQAYSNYIQWIDAKIKQIDEEAK